MVKALNVKMDIKISGRDNVQPESSSDQEVYIASIESRIEDIDVPSWVDVNSDMLVAGLEEAVRSWLESQGIKDGDLSVRTDADIRAQQIIDDSSRI